MKYKALNGFRYADRILNTGDIFEAPEPHGKLLVAIGRAEASAPPTNPPKNRTEARKPKKDRE